MQVVRATRNILVGSACLLAAACAEKAQNIEPAAISTAKYDGWNCTKLAKEAAFVDEALVRAAGVQDDAASEDAFMVFLIGVPTSGGGIKSEVARLKGEKIALRRARLERGCI